nr:retrovirus-related Pol polyprotein from transposon 17.6 [Tanacetum cinerariifolium]
MEELCQPTLNGRGGPISQIAIQETNFGLKNEMIQQVQNSCPFHGPGDDANKHLDKFLHVTQRMKVNGVSDDALRLHLFPYSLPIRAAELFDRFPRNSITTFDQMAKIFLGKYFPPSMVTKLRNEITNFRQEPDESLFEAWEPLADLGASINLMPLSVWKRLSLLELTPTCMALELTDWTISRSIDIAEDVSVKTGHALIDVYKGELTLRVGNESVTFNLDQTSRYSTNYDDMMANRIDVIDMACEEYSQEITGFFDVIMSGNPTPYYELIISTSSPTLTPFGDSDFLLKEFNAFLAFEDDPTSLKVDHSYYDMEKDILLLKAFLKDDPSLPPPTQGMGWRVCIDYRKLNDATRKDHFPLPFMDQMLERLAGNEYYCFLDGFLGYFQIPIDPKDQEKTTFTCPYLTFAYHRMPFSLCNALGTFQRCMMAIFQDMIEKMMEVFMDDFSVFRNSFETCLSHLGKMLKRCKDTNLCLNWEKRHFMVKEGIVIGHNISKNKMEVDKAKVDVIAKLSYPTMVKECIEAFQTLKKKLIEAPILIAPDWYLPFELMCDASNFSLGAVLGQRKEKHFRRIHYASKTMTEAQAHHTTTEKEMLAVMPSRDCSGGFSSFKNLISPSEIKKRAENLAVDHLSRLENPHQSVLEKKETNETFPLETLNVVSFRGDSSTPCDRGTHFCNDQFAKVMLKYGVTHRLATAYHPQKTGQLEVSNRGLKRILERTIGKNRASWVDKLDDAL